MGDFARVALLDGNGLSGSEAQIESAGRRGHVERDSVRLSQEGDAISADLVGRIAVGGDPIRSDDDDVNLSLLHHLGGHVVADENRVDAALVQFPSGESRSLKERPSFIGKDPKAPASLGGGEENGQGGAVVGRGQSAGVAVGQDAVPLADQRGAGLADGPAHAPVFLLNGTGFA